MKTAFNLVKSLALITVVIIYTSCGPDDKCKVICQNGGTCSDNSCVCPAAFSGNICETMNFPGAWSGTDESPVMPVVMQTLTIAAISTDSTVTITFGAGPAAGKTIYGTLDASRTKITYTKQVIPTSTKADTMSGVITLLAAKYAIHEYTYINTRDGITYNLTGHYSKQ